MSALSVYVATADHGLVKIGYSSNPSLRRNSLQYEESTPVSIERAWRATLAERIEERAHEILAPVHVRGEWFKADVETAADAIAQAASEFRCELRPLGTLRKPHPNGGGRKPMNVVLTGVRLPIGVGERIDAIMGRDQRRGEFIREAVTRAC